ncbi:Uu.00g119330.m01.CDS01 [Anthostomella pinea]|uniref:Uu.00g119330.m01.CDS01 n=1 Tax=Anthostomella pinea TaxID=933095 RepID=A0AAI8VHL9_9PEZI|nr:Uu.00g119330.m01.CDS01 [Anthostomella pinea]
MASRLPAFPRTVFTIIEPISLIAGCLGPLFDTDWFIASQIETTAPVISSENARLVALQLGNAYGLLALVGLMVLNTTTEVKVVRNYLIALWIADISHVGLTCWLLGYERSMDVASWNAVTWGNVGFTVFLCLTRTAYLLGLFGPDGKAVKTPKKKT